MYELSIKINEELVHVFQEVLKETSLSCTILPSTPSSEYYLLLFTLFFLSLTLQLFFIKNMLKNSITFLIKYRESGSGI